MTGPPDGPGRLDVLFSNRVGVVMLAGIVDRFFEKIKPILTYKRRGGLYLADVKLSSFARRGLKK